MFQTTGALDKPLQPKEIKHSSFAQDIIKGLSATHKYLDAKYFYDTKGDALFQKIMQCNEYYLTDCEMEILANKKEQIVTAILAHFQSFDLIELGAGDATKSIHLLSELLQQGADYTYYPIDISHNVIAHLEEKLPSLLPNIKMHGLHGEYATMLDNPTLSNDRPKVILFLGANIGNSTVEEALAFCRNLKKNLRKGDLLLIGFDLRKDPHIILNAYNDSKGYTKAFNLNLLQRINHELNANFQINNFEHYPIYNPQTGSCKSYLISKVRQEVILKEIDFTILLDAHEAIFMEISQKYSPEEILRLAKQSGFKETNQFLDQNKWFQDSLWMVE
ncbi:L-histidine N(alpha)-methyltransferase [Olivibacter sp. SDN3]|uniref:L-histidine N(alpha)-methyltransferase n=1 Tax=Olivibacter sp. SDN3 TaxID=2764720 RepID=UPI001650E5FE|nr:L-histidine N(alpha)-methyltransferase [Olivibacter sp. SDN3]QNL49668.1 L-histidine N(alpha)-methyltransferase [Olivibacter sp. SDN3]